MTYVLVSLTDGVDAATLATNAFALWFKKKHPPSRSFHGADTAHEAVKEAVADTQVALVFAHDGGGSLRSASEGTPWADARQFAAMFSGARVWVYACDTMPPKQTDDLQTFGGQARAAGVRVFAGHCSDVAAPLVAPRPAGQLPSLSRPGDVVYVHLGLARALRAFLQGVDDRERLYHTALKGSGRNAAFGARFVEQVMASLRVLR